MLATPTPMMAPVRSLIGRAKLNTGRPLTFPIAYSPEENRPEEIALIKYLRLLYEAVLVIGFVEAQRNPDLSTIKKLENCGY